MLTKEEMLVALTTSGNELIAEKCKKLLAGEIDERKEMKTCGRFLYCVLRGLFPEAMEVADFDNRLALEIALRKKELKS